MNPVVVLPTYNEAENLREIVSQIHQQPGGFHILIVDDGSPDGTGEIADELSGEFPGKVRALRRTRREGLGQAYVAAFRYALKLGYDVIVQMDADLSHSPTYLPGMLREIENSDLVLGSRYVRGVNVVNWDLKRLILSKLATTYTRLVTGMRFTDLTSGFKCWRRETLEAIGLDRIISNGYLFQIETTYRAHKMKFRIVEVSIIFYERNFGRSKINFRIILEALLGVIRLRLKRIG
ncbi:MAG: polyprenol monophosphomannose synthase [Acidobacteriia bacterium]|nr:polyprenol monophosphomannose synthase [Terriglobia bacterium]